MPGIGPALATAIRATFKQDEAFFAAADRMDVQAIASVDGISEQRAVDLIRCLRGDADGSWLGTTATRRVHDDILERIQRFAATRHGRNRLRLLEPLADPAAARARMEHVLSQKAAVAAIDRIVVRKALRQLQALRDPTPVCDTALMVIAADDDEFERLHALGVGKWAVLGTLRDARSASDHDLVIVSGDAELDAAPNAIQAPTDAGLDDLVPHAALAWAKANADVLDALQALADAYGVETAVKAIAPEAGDAPRTAAIPDVAAEVHREATQRLHEAAGRLDLDGATWLAAAGGGPLPPELQTLLHDIARAANAAFRERTGVNGHVVNATLPLTLDEDEVSRLQEEADGRSHATRHQARVAAARRIASVRESATAEVAQWLESDADFALGCFALHHDLHMPRIGDAFQFEASVHLALTGLEAEPIAYRLGGDEPIAVLTGANSGGKSTLLAHLAQLAIMTRLGLPVVGRHVAVPWVEEVHLVTARKGLDAGAFETFLRGFLPIAQGGRRRLVLADEVEAVTELEAAGRILAFFLDRIATTDSLAVIVTHMAPQLLRHARGPLRVDGIEAVGLDEEDRLVVRRCPRLGVFARSTPELIVERLTRSAKGPEAQLYRDLLERLRDPETGK